MKTWLSVPFALLPVCACATEANPPEIENAELQRARTERSSERYAMVREQIETRGIKDPAVLAAMQAVPRHRFVPLSQRPSAYADRALLIGLGQTISQPAVVAMMTEALKLSGTETVLEIGTGSGYQAAVLAEIVPAVYSIEIVEPLAARAKATLTELGYTERVHLRTGDGYRGWPEAAPFDAIIVTAAPDHVPQPLVDQLKPGGRMVLPVGGDLQQLVVIEKTAGGVVERSLIPVRFVPMTGEAEKQGRKAPERTDR